MSRRRTEHTCAWCEKRVGMYRSVWFRGHLFCVPCHAALFVEGSSTREHFKKLLK